MRLRAEARENLCAGDFSDHPSQCADARVLCRGSSDLFHCQLFLVARWLRLRPNDRRMAAFLLASGNHDHLVVSLALPIKNGVENRRGMNAVVRNHPGMQHRARRIGGAGRRAVDSCLVHQDLEFTRPGFVFPAARIGENLHVHPWDRAFRGLVYRVIGGTLRNRAQHQRKLQRASVGMTDQLAVGLGRIWLRHFYFDWLRDHRDRAQFANRPFRPASDGRRLPTGDADLLRRT